MEKYSFEEAYKKLEEIINNIQSGNIPLEELVEKIKISKELISYCEKALKDISEQVKDLLPEDEKINKNEEDILF